MKKKKAKTIIKKMKLIFNLISYLMMRWIKLYKRILMTKNVLGI